jgi:PAS domain S-box-containing protein
MAGSHGSLIMHSGKCPAFFLLSLIALFSFGALAPASLCQAAQKKPVLVLNPGQDSRRLGAYLEILEDPSANLELAQVVTPGMSSRFKPVASDNLNLGVSHSAFWLRFRIIEPAVEKARNGDGWIFDLGQPSLTYVALYVQEAGQNSSQWRRLQLLSRDLKPFPLPSRYAVFRLPSQPGRAQVFYLRVLGTSVNFMAPRIYSLEGFLDHNRSLLWLLGAYCGAILALAIYNLVMFFSLKDRSYLWYVLTIVSMAVYYIGWNGLVQDYVRFLPAELNRHLPIAFLSVLFLCRAQFARYFLLTNEQAPALDKTIVIYSLFMAFITIMVPVSAGGLRFFAIKTSALGSMCWAWLLIFIIWLRWRQGFRPAMYFFLSYLPTAVGQLISMLVILKVLPFSDLAFFSHEIASYFEPILLALALGYRIRSMRKEKQGAELAARESETRYRLVMEAAPDPIAVCDHGGRFSYVNPAFERVFGWNASQAQGKSLQQVMEGRGEMSGGLAGELVEQGQVKTWETRFATKQGRQVDVSISAAALRDFCGAGGGAGGGLVLIMQDISLRKKSEAEREEYQRSLRKMALEVARAEERERRRIAEDLHDSVSQSLAFSSFSLKRLRSQLGEKPQEEIKGICTALDDSLRDIRSLTFEISPPVLYDYGLSVALDWLAGHTAERHELAVEFSEEGDTSDLDQDRQVNLYRACRELLINVVKHAGAKHVNIKLSRQNGAVSLVVEDDGKGFDPASLERGGAGGFGLFSLRERLEPLGGSLKVESIAGDGSRLTVSMPLGSSQPKGMGRPL